MERRNDFDLVEAPGGPGRPRRPRMVPWLVLVAGLVLSVASFVVRERTVENDRRERFQRETGAVVDALSNTVFSYEVVLSGIRDEFARGDPVTRSAYRDYVQSLLLPTRFPAVLGTAWVYNVPSEQVAAFLEEIGVEPPPQPDLAPGRQFDTSYVVTHAAPEDAIGIARGVDARLFPEIAAALEAARDTGEIRLGPRFEVPVRNAVESGADLPVTLAMALPYYRGGADPGSEERRRADIVGWSGIVVEGKPLLATGAGEYAPRYKIELFDGDRADETALVARSRAGADPHGRTRDIRLDLYGHRWTVRLQEASTAADSTPMSLGLLIGGALVTVLIFALMLVLSRSEGRALQMVERATEQLSRQERHFRALVANSTDLVTVSDGSGALRYVSPSVTRILGYQEDDLLGHDVTMLVHPDDVGRARVEIRDELLREGLVGPVEFRLRHADGGWRHIQAVGVNLLDDPAVAGIVYTCRDVTERKAFEDDLAMRATHDPLTGLPNRVLLLDRLTQALARAQRSPERPAVLFTDLDRFKLVNDSFGHATGDDLLVQVAERLRAAVRPGDTVARFGGDEFVVLAEGVRDEPECRLIADRLAAALAAPFVLGGHEVSATASIGIALARETGGRAEDLISDADAAMYRAKQEGRARSVFFDPDARGEPLDRRP